MNSRARELGGHRSYGARARATLLSLLAIGTILVALVAPAGALAADVTFGTPAVKTTYGESIQFSVEVTSSAPLARVELRLGFPGALGPFIVDVPVGAGKTQTLRYQLDLGGAGHIAPNTRLSATWAAFTAVGATPVLSRTEAVRYSDTTQDWKTLKGDIVTVHWYAGSEAFAKKALRIGDNAVRDTSKLLGVTETEPIDFFIYGDETAFRAALGPGTRENVGGQAHSDIRTLFALITPDAINDPWVGIVIPHELTHLVFDTAVSNPYRFPPRWFNEGLAVYLSEGYGPGDRNRVADAVRSKDLLPLLALSGQFPTDPDKTSLAYAEAVSAIDYLVRTNDEASLVNLVLAYKEGLTDDEAFTKALGVDLAAFQAGWLGELGASAPEQFGPHPAPAGPLPSGWSGPAPTSAPGTATGDPGAATDAPGPTADESAAPVDEGQAGSGGASPLLLLAALGLVVLVVAGGLVVARRRGGAA